MNIKAAYYGRGNTSRSLYIR